MKMMKIDMEFVTFDAQDIITASGGPTVVTAWFQPSKDLFSPSFSVFMYSEGTWRYPILEHSQKLYVNDSDAFNGRYIYLTGGVSYATGTIAQAQTDDGELKIFKAEVKWEAGDPAKELKSLNAIVEWLKNPQ